MRIKYLARARDDMMWFRAYYRVVFPEGQRNAKTQLRRTLQLIADYPRIGNPPEEYPEAFEHPISKTPFTVIYRIKDNEVQILRVVDQRSDYSNKRGK